ncbi:MAG: MarR family transcriptional regulator [Fusicatenibacter sp.]
MHFWEDQKVLTSFYSHCVRPVCETYQLTQMEYDILMFLTNNPQYDTASDIVKIRKLTKSHVSSALKALEQRGFIQTAFANNNRKTLHISIQKEAAAVIDAGKAAQRTFGQKLFHGFSKEEMELYSGLFQKLCENARREMEEKK